MPSKYRDFHQGQQGATRGRRAMSRISQPFQYDDRQQERIKD
jgi:hypothetical protein